MHLESVKRCHNEQMHSVARLALSPDLTVIASDGTRLPACRAIFIAASPELKAMLSSKIARTFGCWVEHHTRCFDISKFFEQLVQPRVIHMVRKVFDVDIGVTFLAVCARGRRRHRKLFDDRERMRENGAKYCYTLRFPCTFLRSGCILGAIGCQDHVTTLNFFLI
eukprot:CAMPEP_0173079194 /NCGR_PEP_ID=MMETSP1102-20130122/14911_1 /TAXON_ID=49646 /ORGANISM="Geminigera sp., Strain Caron Lab Isolate" /LENGTH=165 /DNA_ID=CAMNT_0013951295 /DNA_START=517 /DNA_END=1014 /DNA_ORIENTATION=-